MGVTSSSTHIYHSPQQQEPRRTKSCCSSTCSSSTFPTNKCTSSSKWISFNDDQQEQPGLISLGPPFPIPKSGRSKSLKMLSSNGFAVPPVFPKNCSFYDTHFQGGVYENLEQDKAFSQAIALAKHRYGAEGDSGNSSMTHSIGSWKGEDQQQGLTQAAAASAAISSHIYCALRKKKYSLQEKPKKTGSWKKKLLRTFSAGSGKTHKSTNLYEKGDKPSSQPPFGQGADLNREWEIVTVRELCRRLSLEDSFEPSEMPLPEGSQTSQVFDEFMIRQIVDILPPRAEGYPWVKIYSSEKHGFSLATLYRKMSEWTEEMSPVLLVVRDVNGHVFGAVASTALRPNEHYYGTGDSCILYRFTGEFPHTRELRSYTWTGDNQFFINATKEFLSMGAGGGHYGLWLDADLNHGRSQKCATFDNEPLAGGTNEDFVVQFVEAYGFSMS